MLVLMELQVRRVILDHLELLQQRERRVSNYAKQKQLGAVKKGHCQAK